MKAAARGFTLVEIMIVVALVGVLAAIAIPNFMRYQLRAKTAELAQNVVAAFKAEEALRQSERKVDGVSGLYASLGLLPGGCVPGTSRRPWTTTDHATAAIIDWAVEGNTYGCYTVVTGNPSAGGASNGASLAISAASDVDGDGATACVALWKPMLGSDGAVVPGAPAACGVAATSPFGQASAVTGHDVF